MVNFKLLGLPLILAVLTGVSADCAITKSGSTYTPTGCDSEYYLVKETTSDGTTTVAIGTSAANCNSPSNGCVMLHKTATAVTPVVNPVPGYYKTDNGFIECSSKECKVIEVTATTCTAGKLMKDDEDNIKLCLSDSATFEFSNTNDGVYVVEKSNNVFNFDTTVTYYVVKRTENAIIVDLSKNLEKDKGMDTTTNKLLDRKDDFCSPNSAGKYFTCKNGKCTTRDKASYVLDKDTTCTVTLTATCSLTGCSSGYYFVNNGGTSGICKQGVSTIYSSTVRGYLWNTYQYNDVIQCNGRSCEKFVPSVVTDLSSCSNYAGQVIDTGFNLMFCKEASSTPVRINDFNDEYIKGVTGSIFDNPEAYYALTVEANRIIVDETKNGDDDANKLTVGSQKFSCKKGVCGTPVCTINIVKGTSSTDSSCYTSSCKSSDYDGTVFVNASGIEVSNPSEDGFLINISYDSNGSRCTVISQYKNPGYYLNSVTVGVNQINGDEGFYNYYLINEEYPLIYCDSTACRMRPISNVEDGIYYNNEDNKTVIICISGVCTAEEPIQDYYANAGSDLSLINCVKTDNIWSCSQITANSASYYPTIIQGNGSLIYCDSKICYEDNDRSGIFMSGIESKKIISCDHGNCIYGNANNNATPVYYIDATVDEKSLGLLKCTSSGCERVKGVTRSAYISKDGDENSIIVCLSNSCYTEDLSTSDTYFINGGEGKVLIKCEYIAGSHICNSEDGKLKKIYLNGNSNSDGTNGIILCSSTTACAEAGAIEEAEYMSILDSKIVEYDGTSWLNPVSITETDIPIGSSKAYLVNPDTYEILSNNAIAGKLVVCRTVSDTETGYKVNCDFISGNYVNYYINGKPIAIGGGKMKNVLIKSDSTSLSFIETVDVGYYINSKNDIIVCPTKSSCVKYETVDEDCGAGDVGKIKNGQLCVTDTTKIAYTSSGKYLINVVQKAFTSSLPSAASTNYLFNLDGGKTISVVNIKTAKEYYFVTTAGENPSYKLVSSSGVSGTLYGCVNTDNTCTIVPKTPAAYYPNDDSSTYGKSNGFAMIQCDGTDCKSVRSLDNPEYCLITSQQSATQYGLNICNSGCDITVNSCNKITAKRGYYLSKMQNTKLIQCNESGVCSIDKIPQSVYYLSQDMSNPLIQCSVTMGVTRCRYVTTVADGHYISEGKTLVKCENQVCSEVDGSNKWFVSSERTIIKCDGYTCVANAKPKDGWYVNGNGNQADGKYLIKCTSRSGVSTCVESSINFEGHYLNAGSTNNSNKLIDCKSGKRCEEVGASALAYYVNGDDHKLIYCNKINICTAIGINSSEKLWYITADSTELISCSKDTDCELVKEPSHNGYYRNGDAFTAYRPLIMWNGSNFELSGDLLAKGWYKNADNAASASEMIIRCKTSNSCEYVSVERDGCSETIGGKFSVSKGVSAIEWCNTDGKGIKMEGTGTNAVAFYKKADTIPGVPLPEGSTEGYALVKVTSTEVLSDDSKDGYFWDGNSLFYCPKRLAGVCTKEDISKKENFGYYMEHEERVIYRCENDSCDKVTIDSFIKISGGLLKIHLGTWKTLQGFNIEGLYAIENVKIGGRRNFPGADNSRYLLSKINKYYVKFYDVIEEFAECEADSTTTCMDTDEKILINNSTPLNGSNKDISKDGEDEPIEYDYDTNEGYFTYNCSSGDCTMIKVYLKDKEDEKFKYECDIKNGSDCIRKPMAKPPITNYGLTKDKTLMATSLDGSKEAVDQIRLGSYLMNGPGGAKKITCRLTGQCDEKSFPSVGPIIFSGGIKMKKPNSDAYITAEKKNSKFILFKHQTGGNSKRDGEDSNYEFGYDTVLELTHVSYTSTNEARNIFVNSNYYKISSEQDASVKAVEAGYKCNADGSCEEIDKSGNLKYYINTIQIGSNANAYAVCGNGSCELVNLVVGDKITKQNAASTGTSDALISCSYGSGCEVLPSSGDSGLPECKTTKDDNGDTTLYKNRENKLVKLSNGEQLLDLQYCLFEGVPHDVNGNSVSDGVHIFDVALEKLEIATIKEDHVGASMYYCHDNSCYQTYGYIKTNSAYSKCTKSGCKYITRYQTTTCELNGAGSMLSTNEICKSYSNPSADDINNNVGVFAISIDVKDNFPEANTGSKLLVNIQNRYIYALKEDGYILLNGNAIKDTRNDEGTLYECSSNMNCVVVNKPETGYYKTNYGNNYIKCVDNECLIVETLPNGINGFAVDDTVKYVPDSTESTIWIVGKTKITPLKIDNYILLNEQGQFPNDGDDTGNKLYLCTASIGKCEEVSLKKSDGQTNIGGWFVNGLIVGNAIRCQDGYCYSKELIKNCNGNGDFVYKDNVYQLCESKSKSEKLSDLAGKVKKLPKGTATAPIIFPGKEDYVSVSRNSVVGVGSSDLDTGNSDSFVYELLETCTTMEATSPCKINSKLLETGIYCKKDVTGGMRLFKSTKNADNTGSCIAVSDVVVLHGNKEPGSLLQNVNDNVAGAQMYYCVKEANSNTNNCRIATGYLNDIRCDGNGCEKVRAAGGDATLGQYKSTNTIVTNNGDSTTGSEHYFFISGKNNFPGADGKESILVQSGSNYFIIFNGDGYYLIDNGYNMLKREEAGSGTLYLCNSSDLSCVKKGDKEFGYFINAGAEVSNHAIIVCSGELYGCRIATARDCTKADTKCLPNEVVNTVDVFHNVAQCNSTYTGRLIRDKDGKNYRFCYSKNQGETFTANANTIKYYILNLINNNYFTDYVKLNGGTEKNENDSADLLIKITNRSITQVQLTGHILYGSSKDLIENVSTTPKGSMYYCQNGKYKYDKPDETYQCGIVSGVKSGWYFNDYFKDRRFIRCVESACYVAEAPETNVCNYSGSLVFNNGKFKLCKTKEKQIEIDNIKETETFETMVNVSYNQEFPGVSLNNTNIIVNMDPRNVTMNKLDGYVVVNKDSKNIIVQNSDDEKISTISGILYECESKGSCKEVNLPPKNWYPKNNSTGFATELIKCKGQLGDRTCNINYETNAGFYINSNIQMPIIQCIQPGDEIDGKIDIVKNVNDKRICKPRKYNEGWYMNADTDTPLIKCDTENGCIGNEVPATGYYLNAGYTLGLDKLSNATTYPFMKCYRESKDCQYYTSMINESNKLKTKCEKGGDIINTGTNAYKLCKNEKDSVDFAKGVGKVYQFINIAQYDDFPGADIGINIIKLTNKDAVLVTKEGYYYKDKIMYKCAEKGVCTIVKEDENNGIAVFEELTRNIYTGTCSNNSCSWTLYNTEGFVIIGERERKNVIFNYMDDGNDSDRFQDVVITYKCKKNDAKALICEEFKDIGYIYNPNHKIPGTGKVVSTLYKKRESGTDGAKSYIIADVESVPYCTVLPYKQNICYISYENEKTDDNDWVDNKYEAGTMCVTTNGKYYFAIDEINTGIDKPNCIPLPSDNAVNYYKIKTNEVYAVDKFGAIRVSSNNGNYISAVNNKLVWFNQFVSGIYQEAATINQNTITCRNGICTKSTTATCTYDIKSGECKMASGNVDPGQTCNTDSTVYLALTKLSTGGGKCVPYKSNNIDYEDDTFFETSNIKPIHDRSKQYYIVDGKMLTIGEENYEPVVKFESEGVYILDSVNNEVNIFGNYPNYQLIGQYEIDITEKSKYKLIVCDGEGCKRKKSCNAENSFEYLYNKRNNSVLKCNPKNNSITVIKSAGYYLNSLWNDLIKCFDDGYCYEIDKETGMEGYYRDSGNEGKMIICTRNGDKFSCSSKAMIECKYNEDGLCSASTDLLRNSYCFYSKVDKVIGKVEKLIYIDNFIKAGTEGKCIVGSEVDQFVKHKKSKFLKHPEHDDLIRINKDSIVSIYEKELGYYIIDTKEGKGIIEDKDFRKTRLYVCEKEKCKEEKPNKGMIYVNKASSKKLVEYNYSYDKWKVIDVGCEKDKYNELICKFANPNINKYKNDIIYNVDHDVMNIYDVITADSEGFKKQTVLQSQANGKLNEKTFIRYDGYTYLFNKGKQSFTVHNSDGYYLFNKYKYVNVDGVVEYTPRFNLVPYQSTKNVTLSDLGSTVYYDGMISEGYLYNSADIDGLGIVIQVMNVPLKKEPVIPTDNANDDGNTNNEDNDDDDDDVVYNTVIKAVINKCTSTKRNICVNTQDLQTIQEGSVCVVTDGEFKGLYLATSNISKNSGTTNCIRYDSNVSYLCGIDEEGYYSVQQGVTIPKGSYCYIQSGKYQGIYLVNENVSNIKKYYDISQVRSSYSKSYKYIGNKPILFTAQPFKNTLIEIYKDEIIPFRHNYKEEDGYEKGYYVLDENGFTFNSDVSKSANAFNCTAEVKLDSSQNEKRVGYSCLTLSGGQYYYDKGSRKVLLTSNKKWKVETTTGYYFFSSKYLPSSFTDGENEVMDDVDRKIYINNEGVHEYGLSNSGRYLNSAVTNKNVIVVFDNDDYEYRVVNELKSCKVENDGTCSPKVEGVELRPDDSCYDTNKKKLYVVDTIESEIEGQESKTMCYTGSEKVKYALIEGKLYRLDGLSIQKMTKGYFILNKNMEALDSNYPEKPYKIIYCNDSSCAETTEKLAIDQDVIINEAAIINGNSEELNVLLRYYPSEYGKEMFMNVERNGFYCFNSEGLLPGNDDSYYYYNCWRKMDDELSRSYPNNDIYINHVKRGKSIVLYNGQSKEISGITYDSKLDVILFNGEYNKNSERIFKTYDSKLYLLMKDHMSLVSSGLYLMKDGRPFDNGEWTSLSGTAEVCYFNSYRCDNDKLLQYRKHKYVYNMALGTPSIVTYDSENDLWRTVKENGYYFFFNDNEHTNINNSNNYSIDAEDRRSSVVFKIESGNVEIINTNKFKNSGLYLFNDLVVERTSKKTWEDGEAIVENVEVSGKRKCKAIETDEIIESEEFCYSKGKGICVPKQTITDATVNENNCMFSKESDEYYYIINGILYLVNDQFYQRINRDGIYILDQNNRPYDSSNEIEASAYICESGKCELAKKLESQYYLNLAAKEVGDNVILYYNANSKSWKKVDKSGLFFFNKLGFAVNAGDEVESGYIVLANGNKGPFLYNLAENRAAISRGKSKPVLVSVKPEQNIIASDIPDCTVEEETGSVTSLAVMKVGDICLNTTDGKMVIISKVGTKGKREGELSYEGVVSPEVSEEDVNNEMKSKFIYLSNEKKFARIVNEQIEPINMNDGKIILDKDSLNALDSTTPTDGLPYDCTDNVCNEIANDKLSEGKYYINVMNTAENPLVKYMGNGKWKVENEVGHYFLDAAGKPVTVDAAPSVAYEVYKEAGVVKQANINGANIPGYFFNKANNNKNLISNNDEYWSRGLAMRTCNVTTVEEGILCKTTNETITYDAGTYCYKASTKQIYLLLSAADGDVTNETPNCVFGTNAKPKYIDSSETGKKLNDVDVGDQLFQLDNDAIRVAKQGYYIVDQNGYLIDNNDGEGIEMRIFSCDGENCVEIQPDENTKFLSNDGTIYQVDEDNKLQKVAVDGIYFFDNNGDVCSKEECIVKTIIKISNDGKKKENIPLSEMSEGVYINAGNKNVVGAFTGSEWSINVVDCKYESETGSCSNDDIALEVGSYCSADGVLYLITEVSETDKKCISGNDKSPIYFKNKSNRLLAVKSKEIVYIDTEGYYAINNSTMEALVTKEQDKPVNSKFFNCNYGGYNCKEVKPAQGGNYLNRSPVDYNVVKYETGKLEEAITLNNTCTVTETDGKSTCDVGESKLMEGDVCIASSSLYLIANNEECVKAEKSVVTFKVIGQKLFMLTDDAVIQKFNGYYFINGDNRAIISKKDYKKPDTVGYMCSYEGKCDPLERDTISYFPDYSTMTSKHFNVIKFDPDMKKAGNVSKRDEEPASDETKPEGTEEQQEEQQGEQQGEQQPEQQPEENDTEESGNGDEGSSGYDTVSEEGIYELDDGSYAECEYDNNDEISCHKIEETGSYKTKDDKVIVCTENDEGEVECSQATEGGYYVIDGELMECEPNESNNGLVCEEMDKEGYFLAKPDDILYECDEIVEETEAADDEPTPDISKIYDDLDKGNGSGDEKGNNSGDEEESSSTDTTTESSTTTTTETSTTTETTTTTEESTPTPVDVTCKPVECELNKVISFDNEDGAVEMYVCKKPTDSKENKWVPSDCDSGNYVKDGEYYKCEDEKEDVDKNNLEQPNTDHTSKSSTAPSTSDSETATGTDTTSTGSEVTPTGSSSSSSSSKSESQSPTSTKGSDSTGTGESGASSLFRKIPSLSFYLILFIFTFIIFI